jgi:hypothetical protein
VWVVGVLILFIVGVVAIVAIGWRPRADPAPPLWSIPALSGTYTSIVGTVGGFSVASAIFIASLDTTRTSPFFGTVVGMLLIAFIILVLSALMYASTPNVPHDDDVVWQSFAHILANMSGCEGLAISWLALIPLLQMIDLPALASAFTWLMLYVALAGSGWTAMFAYRLTTARAPACLAIPVLGFVLAAGYRLVVVRLAPALWPPTDAALQFTFVGFVVAALTLSLHASLLAMHGDSGVLRQLQRHGHRIALAYSEASALAVSLIWFAVATP